MTSRTRRGICVRIILLALSYLVSTIFYLSVYPSPDQAIFDYIGYLGSIGRPYYKAAFDISWPGPFVYHQIGVELFGVHSWTARLTDALLLPIGLAGIWLFHARAGHMQAHWLAVILYPVLYVTSGQWIAGHRDIVGMHMLVLAAALLIDPARRGAFARTGAGALICYAVLIRPTYLFAALPFFLIDAFQLASARAAIRAFFCYCAGAALVAAPFLLLGWWAGSLGDFYEQAIRFPLNLYQVPLSRTRLVPMIAETIMSHWLWLAIAAALGATLWTGDARSRNSWLYWLALVATVLLSYAVQNKGFAYHASGLMPLLLIAATTGVEAYSRKNAPRFIAPLIGTAATIVLIAGTGARVVHALRPATHALLQLDSKAIAALIAPHDLRDVQHVAIAGIIAAESPADASVLQWGYAYDVAFLAERRSATRYVNTVLLPRITPDDPRFGRWLPIFRAEMRCDPPAFVILDRHTWPGESRSLPLSTIAAAGSATPFLADMLNRDYTVRIVTGDLLVLQRKAGAQRIPL